MRSDAREAAFKIVFARLFTENAGKGFRTSLYKKAGLNEEETAFAEKLVSTVAEKEEELTALLNRRVTRFADYRIYRADKAILLIALAEILWFDDIPPVVSVSEATDLARKYSTEKSAAFVNGVLGGIINE